MVEPWFRMGRLGDLCINLRVGVGACCVILCLAVHEVVGQDGVRGKLEGICTARHGGRVGLDAKVRMVCVPLLLEAHRFHPLAPMRTWMQMSPCVLGAF